MQSRKSQARARRRAQLVIRVSRTVDIDSVVRTLESEYPLGPKDPVLEIVAAACGVQYRHSDNGTGKDVFYPERKELERDYCSSARRAIILTEPLNGRGKPKYSRLRLNHIAFDGDYDDVIAA